MWQLCGDRDQDFSLFPSLLKMSFSSNVATNLSRKEEDSNLSILQELLPFLHMAEEGYSDDPMKFGVSKSFIISDTPNASYLFLGNLVTTDTQVHVGVLEKKKDEDKDGVELVLVFRGTEIRSLPDIVTDLSILQRRVELFNGTTTPSYVAPMEIKAHEGFLKAFSDVTDTLTVGHNIRLVVEQELGVACDSVRKVWCVGHSLGGALATICAIWCRKIGFSNVREINLVTMGSPAVGNVAFAEAITHLLTHSYRLVNKRDPVPDLLNPLFGYHHISGAIYMYDDDQKGRLSFTSGGTRPTSINLSVGDHSIKDYISSVQTLLSLGDGMARQPSSEMQSRL